MELLYSFLLTKYSQMVWIYWIVFFNPIKAAKLLVQNEPLVVTLMFILVFFKHYYGNQTEKVVLESV